ncbi:hypothetical protein SOVF_188260 [Spinacia oleracea]|nr:hypothetical protein SOVF_188260 [Spinacia oleracea]
MNWDLWVTNLQQTHESTWKKVGIFDAIRASTYNLMRDNELIFGLARNWCPKTNTFVFSWGECSITLEDVMILGGFSVLGECVKTPFQSREIEEIENTLVSVFPRDRKSSWYQIKQNEWMDYFMDFGGELEHIAFLVLWLSRYVFSTKYFCQISPYVFPIAIALARGTRIALAPAVLASIYRDLSLLKEKTLGFVQNDKSKLVLWALFQLVQVWAWERFPTLGPKPIALFHGEPRLARWQNLSKLKNKLAWVDFESLGVSFLWRPYALSVENWKFPEFYCDEEMSVLIDSGVGEELLSFAKCLRACELVGFDCTEQYLPQRIGMQFGFDQDIPSFIPRSNDSEELAWSSYDVPLNGVELYLSPRLFKGDVTVQYFDWFMTASCPGYNIVSTYKRQRILTSCAGEARGKMSTKLNVVCSSPASNVPVTPCSALCVEAKANHVISMEAPSCLASSECILASHCLKEAESKNFDSSNLHSVAEAITGTSASCNDKKISLNKSHVDNHDPGFEIDIEKGVRGMDTVMEQVGKCRENCVNKSVNGAAMMQTGTTPSYSKGTTSPRDSLYIIDEAIPTHITQRVELDNEAAASSLKTLTDDEHGNKCVNVKLVSGSIDDPVIIDHDNNDDSEVEARISKLERLVSRIQAAKLRVQASKTKGI